jgi:hypothetical protein
MADWLNDEWAASFAATTGRLPEIPGVSATVCLKFTGGVRKEIAVHWSYADGAPTAGGLGTGPEPSLEFTLSATDARDLLSGAVEPSVAFMRGRLKASGDGGLLLGFLESTTSKEFESWREGAAALAPG